MASVITLKPDTTSHPLYGISGKHVLVIDDQKSARLIMEGVIHCIDPHIKTHSYASPLEAIEWARHHIPDLVLTDYKMREIDGVETVKRLRQLATCADVPIVMSTVSADTTVRHAAFDAGVTDYLLKPCDHYEYRARCRNLLLMREQTLQLRDRARLLESEVAAAMRQIKASEREAILFAANLSEFRAHQNGYRLLRIARYSRLIAEGMGLEPDMVDRIELASTLHDIGKIGLSDDTLAHQHAPSPAQKAELHEHTTLGHGLLSGNTSPYLRMAAEIAQCHHEHYDGNGYPQGIQGRDIPLPARIVAVAEALDTLAVDLQGPPQTAVQGLLDAMTRQKSRQFDPVCVEALCAQREEVIQVMSTFADPE